MGSHSYLQNLLSCKGAPASIRRGLIGNYMDCDWNLQELYVGAHHEDGNTRARHHDGDAYMQELLFGRHKYLEELGHCSGSACNQMRFQELYAGAHHEDGNTRARHHDGDAYMQELLFGRHRYLQNLAAASQWWLIPDASGVLQIVNVDMTADEAAAKQAILIPDVPESSGARPWTQESWNEWNLLEHNGTAHPDRPFSQQYGFEPYLI